MRPVVLSIALGVLLAGCATPTPVGVPLDQTLATPRRTTEYLRWSILQNQPQHAYTCLSQGFIETNKVSRSEIEVFWGRVRDEITRYTGNLQTLEVVEQRDIDDRTMDLDLASGAHRATVRYVLESSYEVRPKSVRRNAEGGPIPSFDAVIRAEDEKLIIELPPLAQSLEPDDLYRITLENAWKVDRIVRHNLEELERSLSKKPTPEP